MNAKVWNLYKGNDNYKRMMEVFNTSLEDPISGFEAQSQLETELPGSQESIDEIYSEILTLETNYLYQGFMVPEEMTREWYEDLIDKLEIRNVFINEEKQLQIDESDKGLIVPADRFREKNSWMTGLSVLLYYVHKFFKPMLCPSNFSLLIRNCETLGIELPELPRTRDYRGAMLWYYDFCEAVNKFQEQNGLTDEEACACLYDFASMLQEDTQKTELPKPINVWITGASKEDYKELEADMYSDSLWQCNENTRRGDIVVVYAVSPHSHIHSIWRADSEGAYNPFNYRQARTHLTAGVKVPPISLAEMKENEVFGKLPMLNNNLQGLNGKRLPTWAYQALLRMIEAKGCDMSKIPVLFEATDWNPGELPLEKDVEEKCLIPCLESLGYKKEDWTRQLSLKAGREEKAIPDFVFFPYGEEHAENAPLIIEAKLDMGSERERDKAYRQGRSYAKMLDAPIMGICDRERLVLYVRNKNKLFDYTKPAFEAHWAAIAGDIEVHTQLMQLIGADVIRNLIKK